MTLKQFLSEQIAAQLASPRLRRYRLVRELDARLNLGYLAARLRDEKAAVEAFLTPGRAKTARISLIMPSYGIRVHYVRDLVRSLRAQSYARWELCICDDADDNRDVARYVQELAAAEPDRFRLTRHASNRGIAAATRSALGLARGDVVAFIDADDLLHPRALECVAHKFAEADEIDVVYTDNDILTDWGYRLIPVHKPAWSPELLLSNNYINHLLAVRRDCLARAGDIFRDDASGAQDWDLCFRLARVARRVGHVPLVLYHWRARPGSIADSMMSKPWAVGAAMRVRDAHVRDVDERLAWSEPSFGDGVLGFRSEATRPTIHVVDLGGQRAPVDTFHYAGPLERLSLPTGTPDLGDALERGLRHLDDQALVLFRVAGQAPLTGSLEAMAAFAILPRVGSVWPFFDSFLRYAYTIANPQRMLVQLAAHRGPFSHCSGNVLTGPMHGLLTRMAAVRQAGGFVAGEPFAVGARFGLACLQAGLRNVSARGATCAQPLPPLALPLPLSSDPYL